MNREDSFTDDVASLRERLRAGTVGPAHLRLAAQLGDRAARSRERADIDLLRDLVLGDPAQNERAVCDALRGWPPAGLVRFAFAAACYRIRDGQLADHDDVFGRLAHGFRTVRTWILEPTSAHAEPLPAARDQAGLAGWGDHPETGAPLDDDEYADTPTARALEFVCFACVTAASGEMDALPGQVYWAVVYANVWQEWADFVAFAADQIVPWALGRGDSLDAWEFGDQP